MGQTPYVSAILVAAGASTRMGGGVNKQLMPIHGKPALYYTIKAFEDTDAVREIVLVCRRQEAGAFAQLVKKSGFQKVKAFATGGATRQESVISGIASASAQADYFAIHDGARCMVTPQLIEQVIQDAVEHRAATAAVPVKDTIKVSDSEGFVWGTPRRSVLWAVQTPQIFEKTLYMQAVAEARKKGADYTDDCQLVEQLGARVHLCMGSYENNKLTTSEDLALAEQILKKREEAVR